MKAIRHAGVDVELLVWKTKHTYIFDKASDRGETCTEASSKMLVCVIVQSNHSTYWGLVYSQPPCALIANSPKPVSYSVAVFCLHTYIHHHDLLAAMPIFIPHEKIALEAATGAVRSP